MPLARYELGLGLAFNGKTTEAIAQFRESIRIDPYLSPAYTRPVLLLAEANQNVEALKTFDQAIERNLSTPELALGPCDGVVRSRSIATGATRI